MIGLAPAAASAAERFDIAYTGRFMGLPVMKAWLAAHMTDSAYETESSFRSAGIAGFFKTSRVDAQARGARRPDSLALERYGHLEWSGRKQRAVAISHWDGDIAVQVEPPLVDLGEPPPTEAHVREALDPLSAILSITFEGGQTPCARTTPVFDGKLRYDLVFTPVAREEVRTRAYRGPAWRCRAHYRPVAGFDPSDLANGEVYDTPIHIWLTDRDDGVTAPVRIATRFELAFLRLSVRVEATELAVGGSGRMGDALTPP